MAAGTIRRGRAREGSRLNLGSSALGSQGSADLVQKLEQLPVRVQERRFVVVNAFLAAELLDDRLRTPHIQSRHAREEVMLDLVVERAVPEVGQRMADYVACRQRL